MFETTHITTPAAAAVFDNPRQRKIVLALIEQERSLSQLARLTDTPLNLLHHHMAKFVRLRLVRITRRQARAGAPIKFYRATARRFFVPAELARDTSGDSLRMGLRAALDRSLADTVKGRVYSSECTGPRMRIVGNPQPRATAIELWRELRLKQPDAAALAEELKALMARYERRVQKSGRTYLLHAALAPL